MDRGNGQQQFDEQRAGAGARFRLAIRAAHCPPGAASNNVYCEIVRHDITAAADSRAWRRAGSFSRGGPASVYEPTRTEMRSGNLSTWAFPCSASATACSSRARRWAARSRARRRANLAGARCHRDAARAICSPACPTRLEVWMSHGDQVGTVSGDFMPLAQHGDLPDRRGEASRRCRCTACNFIPK